MPECEHPGNITNGEVTFYGGTIIRHGIIYSCDEGYILNGISTRLCMIGGSWSGSEPTCEGETPSQHVYNVAIHICT